jgi:periplasmic copper chaperone A
MSLSRIGPVIGSILLVLLSVAACSSAATAEPTIRDAWVRPPMTADLPAAGYLTIVGGSEDDALVAASSPIATSVEIHETMADASGMTGMQAVDEIDVAPGATVALEPGGYHLMLMGVTDLPAVGSTVQLTLTFELAGDIVVDAEVRAG